MNLNDAITQIKPWLDANEKIILVTGVFDLLHIEHIRFLKKAKSVGDRLVVGIETDARVKSIKGEHRPINHQKARLEQIGAIKYVDTAFLLPRRFNTQAHWEKLIQDIKPHTYAVSSHTSHLQNKRKIVQKFGCKFKVVHKFNPEFSTSKLYRKLTKDL